MVDNCEAVNSVSLRLCRQYCQSCQFSHFVVKTKDFMVKMKEFFGEDEGFFYFLSLPKILHLRQCYLVS